MIETRRLKNVAIFIQTIYTFYQKYVDKDIQTSYSKIFILLYNLFGENKKYFTLTSLEVMQKRLRITKFYITFWNSPSFSTHLIRYNENGS